MFSLRVGAPNSAKFALSVGVLQGASEVQLADGGFGALRQQWLAWRFGVQSWADLGRS